MQVLPSQNII